MRYPKKLCPGDTVGLICPSSPTTPEKLEACVEKLTSMGCRVRCADNLTESCGGYMAGSARTRADSIHRMFADPEIDAIFCVRGGDGSARVMEYLDYELIRANPKIFVGYSDVTNLNVAFNQFCDLVTFHGPMVSSNMLERFDEYTERAFFDCLNADDTYTFRSPPGLEPGVIAEGCAEGRIIGGNLSLLSAAVGTPYDADVRGKILFIEEVFEPVTKIEKWMMHLRNAGKFEQCSGILLGQFTRMHNRFDPAYTELNVFRELLSGLHKPVMYGVQSGHGDPMITIPLGAPCRIDTRDRSIVFEVER